VINAADSIQQKLEEVVGSGFIINSSRNLEVYFGCTVLDRGEIQPRPTLITKGRGKRMMKGVEKAVEK